MDMKEWKEKVLCRPVNGCDVIGGEEQAAVEDYSRGYRSYLDRSKTERECVRETVRLAELKGFRPLVPGERPAPEPPPPPGAEKPARRRPYS